VATAVGLWYSVVGIPPAGADTTTLTANGATYTVPAGVTSVAITLTGASGADASGVPMPGDGGRGAITTFTLAVTPGDVLTALIGGGGSGGAGGGRGGDRVGVTRSGTTLGVAGGGGGGGAGGTTFASASCTCNDGGAGGDAGAVAEAGHDGTGAVGSGGGAGTGVAPGDGGTGGGAGTDGSGSTGGDGGNTANSGGGGGGGYFGAGGGAGLGFAGGGGGGGAGSSFVLGDPDVTDGDVDTATGTTTASVRIEVAEAAAPTDLVATAGDGEVSVAFTAPADPDGASITNYEYSVDGGDNWATRSPAATTSPLVITDLTNYTSYDVQLRAVAGGEAGAASASVTAQPEGAVAGGATAAAAVALPQPMGSTFVGTNAGVTSASSSPAQPYWNNTTWWHYTPAADEHVTVQATATSPASWDTTLEIWTVGGTFVTQADDTYGSDALVEAQLTGGTTYRIGLGGGSAADKGTAQLALADQVPAAPVTPTVTVDATAGSGRATVDWAAPDDHRSPITGYTVRAFLSGGSTVKASTTVTGTPPATTAVVTGLTPGQSYVFTVVATSRLGDGSASPSSAAATPREAPGSASAPTVAPPTPPAVATPPAAPTLPQAVAGGGIGTGAANPTALFVDGEGDAVTVRMPGAAPLRAIAAAAAVDRDNAIAVTGAGVVYTTSPRHHFGDIRADTRLNERIVNLAPYLRPSSSAAGLGQTPVPSDLRGYWLVGADGGVFAFGGAPFLGSAASLRLVAPVVAMAPTPSGRGYWLVAADGGVFDYGDAGFFGSRGGRRLNQPIVALLPTPSGRGYWLVAADGGVFAFGDARFEGAGLGMGTTIGGLASPSGAGYWLVSDDRRLHAFGDAPRGRR
jgi:hypothetical protein